MWTPEYYVRQVELPRSVDGVVIPNDDGTFDIYLNARQNEETKRKWLEHEIEHIREDHFYRSISVALMEMEANGLSVPISEELPVPRDIIQEFCSPASVLLYYLADPERISRDYRRTG